MQILHLSELDEIGVNLFQTRRGLLTLEQVREWLDLGEIVRLFHTWAVTDYGVECLVEYYPIEAKRLTDPHWIDHMTEKSWMTAAMLRDLSAAIEYAKEHFNITRSGKFDRAVRFAIFKRDGYRCQLCGRSAREQGVILEVDHKIPRAKGGTDDRRNLWTLCFDCNRGKRDTAL